VPVSSHVSLKPLHVVQPPGVLPQLFPSVLRVQACVSVLVVATHCPLAQLYEELVTVRVCVPVCAHASLKLHALHAP